MPPAPLEISRPGASATHSLRSGKAVLAIAAMQIVVSICLLGIYEGYKASFYRNLEATTAAPSIAKAYADPLDYRSPMGAAYFIAIVQNVFAVFGLAGILSSQRSLIVVFFTYNAAQMVVAFHFFVDLCTELSIHFKGEPGKLIVYERAVAAFVFLSFALSIAATVFSVRSVDEMKAKQREEYNRFTVLSDTLQWEADS